MSAVLIDYGCHSFTYRLASRLRSQQFPIRYFANGSLESPNLTSLAQWEQSEPDLVRVIRCTKPYGKVSLRKRLAGEIEWARHCTTALAQERPSIVISSCIPIAALTAIQSWTHRRRIPFVYWLQDLQGRAIHDLLGRKLGFPGRVLGSFAHVWEQHMISRSQMVINIAREHARELPHLVRREDRYAVLENWANVEEIPQYPSANAWSQCYGLSHSQNLVYSGTLGLKHDLPLFLQLAEQLGSRKDVRVVVVSSGQAADKLKTEAASKRLSNLIVLPFQPYSEVPQVLASASVLIAPLDGSAGKFCVPSKVLSYFCAGRPTVIAIDRENPAAAMIEEAGAGLIVPPGDSIGFINSVLALLDDPDLRSRMGVAARKHAERTFSLDNVVPKFLDILRRAGAPVHTALKPAVAVVGVA